MNGKKAKQLRRNIFGDYSHRVKKYDRSKGATRCIGLRAAYQKAKKEIKNGNITASTVSTTASNP